MRNKSKHIQLLIGGLICLMLHPVASLAQATPQEKPKLSSGSASTAPSRQMNVFFNHKKDNSLSFTITGLNPDNIMEFNLRRDEIISKAQLNLSFTPSPSLIPIQSQLQVYLNEELMGVIAITNNQLGKQNQIEMLIDPHFIKDYNQLRIQFNGHYTTICENPANTTLWVAVSKSSSLNLTVETLALENDLSHFPEPFFDSLDKSALVLPMVFATQPSLTQFRAAAILASWFGSKSQWRGQTFPALFNQLPERNAVLFVTNQQRPDFLKNYKSVNAPTIEMMNHPSNPYVKFLIVSGRDDNDLITAVEGISVGSILFRGQSVNVDQVKTISPRQAYDAPNWIRTDKPTSFTELQQYNNQLQTSGFNPYPINIPFNLPPDLFLNGSPGIKVSLNYHYSAAPEVGHSNLNISLNDFFVKSYALSSAQNQNSKFIGTKLLQNLFSSKENFSIPVSKLGSINQLEFEFSYVNVFGEAHADGRCISYSLTNNHAAIDSDSTIDFSNYYHYIAMPNLNTFTNAGFPFSRMADLSQTTIVINKQATTQNITTLLNVVGNIGSQTGYPALALTLTDDWLKAKDKDSDILIIGNLPPELFDNTNLNMLMDKNKTWVNKPFRQEELPLFLAQPNNTEVNSKVFVSSDGILSAIIGFQSPSYNQRSIIALLANSPRGFELLNNTLTQTNSRTSVFGSVSVIRESGVSSLQVGPVYYVGHLPWYTKIWFALQKHPINIALATLMAAIIVTFILWRLLAVISRNRLKK